MFLEIFKANRRLALRQFNVVPVEVLSDQLLELVPMGPRGKRLFGLLQVRLGFSLVNEFI